MSERISIALLLGIIVAAALVITYATKVQRYETVGPVGLAIAAGGAGATGLTLFAALFDRSVHRADGYAQVMTFAGAALAVGLAFDGLDILETVGLSIAAIGASAQIVVNRRSGSRAAAMAAVTATVVGVLLAMPSLATDGVSAQQITSLALTLALLTAGLLVLAAKLWRT